MFKRNHPAYRARATAGVIGVSTYLGLVWVISAEAEAPVNIDLSASLQPAAALVAQSATSLQLSGSATPGSTEPPAPAVTATVAPDTVAATLNPTDLTVPPTSTVLPTSNADPATTQPVATEAPTTQPPDTQPATTETPTTHAPTTTSSGGT